MDAGPGPLLPLGERVRAPALSPLLQACAEPRPASEGPPALSLLPCGVLRFDAAVNCALPSRSGRRARLGSIGLIDLPFSHWTHVTFKQAAARARSRRPSSLSDPESAGTGTGWPTGVRESRGRGSGPTAPPRCPFSGVPNPPRHPPGAARRACKADRRHGGGRVPKSPSMDEEAGGPAAARAANRRPPPPGKELAAPPVGPRCGRRRSATRPRDRDRPAARRG
jgi:hypothetical protein